MACDTGKFTFAKMASMLIDYSFCHVGNCCYKLTHIIFLSDFLFPASCECPVNVETHPCACAGNALCHSTAAQSEMP